MHVSLLKLPRQIAREVTISTANTNELDRIKGCLVGLACGDAVGTTLEFQRRGSFEPITDMMGGGPFQLRKGEWTDDTSLALCLAASLIECGGFDPDDQMQRYLRWWEHGYMSSNGRCFDIGNTCSNALRQFKATGEAYCGSTDTYSAGNGSLMRLAPIPIAYRNNTSVLMEYAALSSKTTHGNLNCIDSCRLFANQIRCALNGGSKQEVLEVNTHLAESVAEELQPIASNAYLTKTYDQITGSGYVVESLESALWCFANSGNFREAILQAANLGNDADTTAAICGQIAGAHYGYSGIPEDWRNSIAMADEIVQMAIDLAGFGTG